ncbi:glucose-6-phosphate isomerase [thiotrophic endosymbiont of Bathymodiolus puteoserpentis (Logatchev)]|uniref:glucose-6-phosphate isomerase n=1 Tax=thiotrophic endosymbiont of Bathymodiolus puteoserpentis (Logatchev) TaxID=343240 RepID=UPI0010B5796D|nr:glucose-6-phosphate isomerase [thiotrophic endosymbiont of Bathymodiolus puteoserpentis (Logatchev)]CAC9661646.1 Glucose-6-phosphate isomerase (EC 5.3.1.9) [uncultured Gammaproteobacteria bacterium]CAC9995532.1 Glucose-6-phosphate isomerase (EC 5.3.1.9) [uncultured Gammaproteobacteria bacterium]SSC09748.1 Glucose-6-phosphate isomerase [thiotrophic endosymbiont of Bathymodiolus puteoserpentis (Logatchev)]
MEYNKNFYQIHSNGDIFQRIQSERGTIGYYDLPYQDTSDIKAYAKTIVQKHIVVIGIGGSSLGVKAIYEFLLPSNKYQKDLVFLETLDPLEINHCLTKFDIFDAHFVVISKSGNTIETISLFKYLRTLVEINSDNCTVISKAKSGLTKFAQDRDIKVFELAENVGGRFSVFSVVGLVPLAMVGVDVDNLLNGCKRVSASFFDQSSYYAPIIRKARFLVENKARFNINVIFSYSSSLEGFNKWYVQLWAESLGKININKTRQALTPIALIGPVDQHSFLQLIIDGVRDKTVTFIKIADLKDNTIIPKSNDKNLGLEYAEGLSFNDLLNKQADATIESVEAQGDIPCDVITISTVDEYNIAKLMFSYQLLVSAIGEFLQINTYNQPGVEKGKAILKESLQN